MTVFEYICVANWFMLPFASDLEELSFSERWGEIGVGGEDQTIRGNSWRKYPVTEQYTNKDREIM